MQRLLDNVKWDGLLDRNRRRLINDRAKAVKALSNRPFLRRHILEEMKRRFLAERRGKALITHPVNKALVTGLTPSVYFDLFSDELYQGCFPKDWLVNQLLKITALINKVEQHQQSAAIDLAKLLAVSTLYYAINGGEAFQNERLDFFTDAAVITYTGLKIVSLLKSLANIPDDLEDYKSAAGTLRTYLSES